MKTIIAGSRGISKFSTVERCIIASGFHITEVVSGTARGVDQLGEEWASCYQIPIKRFPADWNKYGKSAGYKRNVQMAEYANALIAIWDGESKGTKHMIDIAKNKELKVFVVFCPKINTFNITGIGADFVIVDEVSDIEGDY
jgi:hypothetical protein